MSGISYRDRVNPWALYAGMGSDICSRPALGIWWSGTPISRLMRTLAQYPNSFIDVRWLADACGISTEDLLRRFGPLEGLARRGDLVFVAGDQVVVSPASLASTWPAAVARVLAAVGTTAVSYRIIAAKIGKELSETSTQTILQSLSDAGRIAGVTAGVAGDWSSTTFRRAAA